MLVSRLMQDFPKFDIFSETPASTSILKKSYLFPCIYISCALGICFSCQTQDFKIMPRQILWPKNLLLKTFKILLSVSRCLNSGLKNAKLCNKLNNIFFREINFTKIFVKLILRQTQSDFPKIHFFRFYGLLFLVCT